MDDRELLGKYAALLEEVERLTKENVRLRAQLELTASDPAGKPPEKTRRVEEKPRSESTALNLKSFVDHTSHSYAKIQ